MNLESYKRTDR